MSMRLFTGICIISMILSCTYVLCIIVYTMCYLTGIFYAVIRQISMLFIDNNISVFYLPVYHCVYLFSHQSVCLCFCQSTIVFICSVISLSACLPLCLSVQSSVCLPVYHCVYLFSHQSVCLSTIVFICSVISLSACLPLCLSVQSSVCLPVYHCVYLFSHQSVCLSSCFQV